MEFAIESGLPGYLEGDVMVEEDECATFVKEELEEMKSQKLPWSKARHLRPLYIKVHVNCKPMSRVLIDGSVVLNVMPFSMVKKLGKGQADP